VRDHYISTYVESVNFPLPLHASPRDRALVEEIPREQFQARKKRRIEERKEKQKEEQKIAAQPKQKPTASVPSCHEVQGFMPGRLEFETEYFNEAEEAVQHMQFDPGDGTPAMNPEGQQELDLKMTIMNIYNERLTARVERKKIIFEHNLLNYKANQVIDKKRTKEQRDLINRAKPFARMMTHADYEELTTGLEYEHDLRHAINTLQEWRSMQITDLKAGEKYEIEKLSRTVRPPTNNHFGDRLASRGMNKPTPPVDVPTASTALVSNELTLRPFDASNGLTTPPSSETDDPVQPNGTTNTTQTTQNGHPTPQSTKYKYSTPSILGISALRFDEHNNADLHLLTPEEKDLCKTIRIHPKPYVMLKEAILQEAVANGGVLKKKGVQELCKTVDRNKLNKIFDFFVGSGWIGKG
jgi:transcriptional adapter 2-alpha